MSEDWYLWLRLAARYSFHFDTTVTSAVIQHEGRSLENIDVDKLKKSTFQIVKHLKKDNIFLEFYGKKAYGHFADHFTFLALMTALKKTRKVDTIKALLIAVRYDPTVIIRKRFLASLKHLI